MVIARLPHLKAKPAPVPARRRRKEPAGLAVSQSASEAMTAKTMAMRKVPNLNVLMEVSRHECLPVRTSSGTRENTVGQNGRAAHTLVIGTSIA
jgi:hypothetical protein